MDQSRDVFCLPCVCGGVRLEFQTTIDEGVVFTAQSMFFQLCVVQ